MFLFIQALVDIILNRIHLETWSFLLSQLSSGWSKESEARGMTLKVNCSRWQQNPKGLRKEALSAQHPRTRERLMALYEIAQGKSATQVGRDTKRNPQTVMEWVHRYNQEGPTALEYRHTGGHLPLCQPSSNKRSMV